MALARIHTYCIVPCLVHAVVEGAGGPSQGLPGTLDGQFLTITEARVTYGCAWVLQVLSGTWHPQP